jgi:signal transduction histidine kinase
MKKPEQAREYLDISKLELQRLALLVDKVLRLSMFEEKQPRLQLEPLDLAALVRQVLSALRLQAESAGAGIHFETKENLPIVNGDRLHLTSVVFNLVDNALKYRIKERPEIRISLNSLPENKICLTVQDNGIGIAPEYQSRVFEKFFRVPEGNVHNVKGHGLGLSYVAEVIRQHGGSIRVESQPGEGSAFVVELPGNAPETEIG